MGQTPGGDKKMKRRSAVLTMVGIMLVTLMTIVAEAVEGTMETDVTVEEAPLTWRQVANSDGEVLYDELCAVCHGTSGNGDGPAASALKKMVPDLTTLSARNDGMFPREAVEKAITGETRVVSHGTVDMPVWGKLFSEVRPDRKPYQREVLGRQRIYNLTSYLESIQSYEEAEEPVF